MGNYLKYLQLMIELKKNVFSLNFFFEIVKPYRFAKSDNRIFTAKLVIIVTWKINCLPGAELLETQVKTQFSTT